MESAAMEYIEYPQFQNRSPYYYANHSHPNGQVADQYTADLLGGHIAAGGGVVDWRNRIGNLRFVRLPDSTKYMAGIDTRAARQSCYEPVGVPLSVREYVQRVADLPEEDRVSNANAPYEDLWRDCQGGLCLDEPGVVGRPYLKFLPPADPESADAPDA